VPFVLLGTLPRGELTNVQFKSYAAFDLWVDDVAFFVGPANCCPAQCQTNFTIPDPILESYILSAGGNGSKPLTCGDVCYLNELSATGGVQSLTGLECSPQLAMLGLQSNQITDLSPLAQLSWLSQLYLNGNRITHLDALAGLSHLQTLILANNQIENVKPLMGLPLTHPFRLHSNCQT
jgi:Leucine-rich repeat (LRR) protein